MQHDPQAALAYIQNQPGSTQNKWLLSHYAITRAQSDPVGALDWASEQNDPQILEQTLSELAWSWPESGGNPGKPP